MYGHDGGIFYLSTVERIFKGLEIAQNRFTVDGKRVDIGKITTVAVKTVEGGKDDISAPGQCVAALDLCTGLPDSKKGQLPGTQRGPITASSPAAAGATRSARWSWTSSTPTANVPKAPVKGVAAS